MAPYEQCWCRSGKKYKCCHFRRDRQKPVNIFAVDGLYRLA
ncbi:SEC-C metal-binding domain-containing protein [Sinorhizobium meliloti]|nr:SEC-C metal-binding domain-containing protein [Sinorhizobium meliloti]